MHARFKLVKAKADISDKLLSTVAVPTGKVFDMAITLILE
jgi:hypothetical protein